MRLATFNMRSGGSPLHWTQLMEAASPQLIFAQETRDPRSIDRTAWGGLQPDYALWAPVEHGRWGSALVALEATITPVELDLLPGWVVGGYIESAGRPFLAFSVHLPPTRSSYVRTAHLLLDALERVCQGEPLVLAGDWNLTASARANCDPYRSRRDEVDLLSRLSTEFDLIPAWSSCNPDRPLPQTLRWTRDPSHPFHCDGMFVPAAWRGDLAEAMVLAGPEWSAISDHNAVVASFEAAIGPEPVAQLTQGCRAELLDDVATAEEQFARDEGLPTEAARAQIPGRLAE